MAGDVKVAVVSGQLSGSSTGTADFTKSGFGTPKACIVIVTVDTTDDTSVAAQSRMSIGFSDFTNKFCITHQDEDASAKVDCDAMKVTTDLCVILSVSGTTTIKSNATTITDGVRLTNSKNTALEQVFVTVIMFGGADLTIILDSTIIASVQNGTVTRALSGFTDGNDKLIFFIGSDIGAENSVSTGINNSFGVCHATGSDAGGWTLVQRCLGWASDHNATEGAPSAIISTDRVLDIITEAGGQDWGLEVTDLEHISVPSFTVTTRDAGSGAGMEVYFLALDLDDRKAKVGSVNSPTSGTTWTPSVSLGFTPQYVGLGLTGLKSEDTINGGVAPGFEGISSNTGGGEETCHSWYNDDNAAITDTANLFRSRVIDWRNNDTSVVLQDQSHSSFDSGGWTYTINTENETTASKWFYWAIEEVAAAGEVIVAIQGSYTLTGQASNLFWDHRMPAAQGSYALNGQAAIITRGFVTVAAQGSYLLNGQIANLLRTHIMLGDQGSYALNGQTANLLWNHLVEAVQGSYSLTGFAATLSRQVTIVGAQGSYTLTGIAADLLWNHLITAVQGSYAYTGFAAETRVGFTMEADQGSYLLNGQSASLLWNHLISAIQGNYTYTGFDAITFVTAGETLTAIQGSYILTGQPAILTFSGAAGGIYKPMFRPRRRG